jgi:hypothetical protein
MRSGKAAGKGARRRAGARRTFHPLAALAGGKDGTAAGAHQGPSDDSG